MHSIPLGFTRIDVPNAAGNAENPSGIECIAVVAVAAVAVVVVTAGFTC